MDSLEHQLVFNIYGGYNLILPKATNASQNFYGDAVAEKAISQGNIDIPLTPEEQRLSIYINKVESLRSFIGQLTTCRTAKEVGELVTTIRQQENLSEELIVKKDFITLLLPFLVNVETGKGVDNLRVAINNALESRKRVARQSLR